MLTALFFQHFKNVLLFSEFHGFWWKIYCQMNCFSTMGNWLFFLWLLSICFSLSLVIRHLFITFIGVNWGVGILFGFAHLLESVGLCLSPNLGLFILYFLSCFVSLLLLGVLMKNNLRFFFSLLSHRSLMLC